MRFMQVEEVSQAGADGPPLSTVDDIHQIAGGVTEVEAAKAPGFLDGAVDHFGARRPDGGLCGVEIIDANGDDREVRAGAAFGGCVQLDLLRGVAGEKRDPSPPAWQGRMGRKAYSLAWASVSVSATSGSSGATKAHSFSAATSFTSLM